MLTSINSAATRLLVAYALFAALLSGAAAADPAGDPRTARIDAAVEALRAEHDVPGVSLAIIHDGRVVHARGYGHLARGRSTPVGTHTMFQACSLSKPLVATALMQLVEEGRLELDAPVNAYLQSWQIPDSELTGSTPITVRHLLTHTSGLTAGMHPGYVRGSRIPDDIVGILEGRPPANTKPVRPSIPVGTWRYSNGAFVVAQLLLEELTGEPLAGYMRREILDPLGMHDSTYESPFPDRYADRAARGHDDNGRELEGGWREHRAQAVAGLWSTASDIARSMIALQDTAAGGEGLLLEPGTARLMLTPVPVEPGPRFSEVPVFDPRQGIAYLLEGLDPDTGESLRFWAWGDNTGYKALQVGLIDGHEGAVILTNSQSGVGITRPIVELIAREYGWALPGNEPPGRARSD